MIPIYSTTVLYDSSSDLKVAILVGLDQYWELVTGKIICCPNGTTAAYWVFSGLIQSSPTGTSSVNLLISLKVDTCQQQMESTLDSQLKMFRDPESLGARQDEPSVYDEFQKGIVYKQPHYEVSLPWRWAHPPLNDHYELALRRLNGLLKRPKQTPEFLRQYNSVIKEQY